MGRPLTSFVASRANGRMRPDTSDGELNQSLTVSWQSLERALIALADVLESPQVLAARETAAGEGLILVAQAVDHCRSFLAAAVNLVIDLDKALPVSAMLDEINGHASAMRKSILHILVPRAGTNQLVVDEEAVYLAERGAEILVEYFLRAFPASVVSRHNLQAVHAELKLRSVERIRRRIGDVADAVEDEIDRVERRAQAAEGVVSSQALGVAWSRRAAIESAAMVRWRAATVCLGLAVVGGSAAAVVWLTRENGPIRWDLVIAKAVAAAALGGVAAFTARQSAHHRSAELYARQLAIDYSILPAFIADLSAGAQEEIKRAVALARLAAPITAPTASGADVAPVPSTTELLELLRALSQKI